MVQIGRNLHRFVCVAVNKEKFLLTQTNLRFNSIFWASHRKTFLFFTRKSSRREGGVPPPTPAVWRGGGTCVPVKPRSPDFYIASETQPYILSLPSHAVPVLRWRPPPPQRELPTGPLPPPQSAPSAPWPWTPSMSAPPFPPFPVRCLRLVDIRPSEDLFPLPIAARPTPSKAHSPGRYFFQSWTVPLI